MSVVPGGSLLARACHILVWRQAAGRPGSAALQGRFELVCLEIARAEWTDQVSHAYGRIKAALERRGERIEDFDAAIAAHALALGATLVTANLGHMQRVPGLTVEDWSTS